MSLLSVAHQDAPRSSLAVALRALASSFIAWRAQRARRLAMLSLLEMDAWAPRRSRHQHRYGQGRARSPPLS